MITTAKTAEDVSTTLKPSNSPIRAESWCQGKTDGLGTIADALTTRMDLYSDQNGMRMTARRHENISLPSNKQKVQNLPIGAVTRHIHDVNGLGNRADGSTVSRDMHNAAADTKTAENMSRKVRKSQSKLRIPNSPPRLETETPKCPR